MRRAGSALTAGARAGSGERRLSFEEFLPVFNGVKAKPPMGSAAEFIDGLRVFDKDGNGTINAAELRRVLTSLGEKLSDDDVDALLANVKVDARGGVNYEGAARLHPPPPPLSPRPRPIPALPLTLVSVDGTRLAEFVRMVMA